jgi:hypothetical protein
MIAGKGKKKAIVAVAHAMLIIAYPYGPETRLR